MPMLHPAPELALGLVELYSRGTRETREVSPAQVVAELVLALA